MDINKRTILWIVFAVSLIVLWNNWNVSTGHPSMFAPTPLAAKAPASLPSAVPNGSAMSASATGMSATPGAAGEAAPFKSERITVTTDVMKADIDTLGGQIVRLELLQFKDGLDPTKHQVLFDKEPTTSIWRRPAWSARPTCRITPPASRPCRAPARWSTVTRCNWCWKRPRAASS